MKRPWQVWLTFTLCSALVAAAMCWLTVHALRVDRERSEARAEAELEQRVSLALWRMDTKLAPLIAEEVARPPAFYDSFITIDPGAGKGIAPEQVPSPLLNGAPSNVLLNFDASVDGQWKSPQAPPAELVALANAFGCSTPSIESNRDKLAKLSQEVDVELLVAQLPAQPLPEWGANQQANPAPQSSSDDPFGWDDETGQVAPAEQQPGQQAYVQNYKEPNSPAAINGYGDQQQRQEIASGKATKGVVDFGERSGRLQQATQQEFNKSRGFNAYLPRNIHPSSKPVVENVSRPLWIGEQLLLARRLERDGQTFVQGSWLDWPRLKKELLAETADLLPKADLAPVQSDADAEPTRMLAGLPVQLVVADTATALAQLSGVDAPLQWALGFGWIALLLALLAVAGLLWGVLSLSERRAAFVSSVTHELRTPLTTFRMYAEMLARDMVPSPERRREYLETLKTESERLTHLVENVLSYARLERGRRPKRAERTTAVALVERFEPRLAERAARAQMQLECKVDAAAVDAPLLTDVGVVEQILFNLVDNAAKYAGRATDRRICVHADRQGDFIHLAVSDFGPGFASPKLAARSAPFSKSAQEAAESAPGVGLGLALCRRLARELGGRLEIAAKNGRRPGAAVTLKLPIGG
ncbi:MAG: sensor histidine kinase [Pirellulales bacterium]|nr:sensor histidine kinase [Pirellulales bacterium]